MAVNTSPRFILDRRLDPFFSPLYHTVSGYFCSNNTRLDPFYSPLYHTVSGYFCPNYTWVPVYTAISTGTRISEMAVNTPPRFILDRRLDPFYSPLYHTVSGYFCPNNTWVPVYAAISTGTRISEMAVNTSPRFILDIRLDLFFPPLYHTVSGYFCPNKTWVPVYAAISTGTRISEMAVNTAPRFILDRRLDPFFSPLYHTVSGYFCPNNTWVPDYAAISTGTRISEMAVNTSPRFILDRRLEPFFSPLYHTVSGYFCPNNTWVSIAQRSPIQAVAVIDVA
ncbi:hypothetical protein J6590_060983 [Homalodisca vitripennis]|nr:hypothetical protein J6590_060983 [Homalodisca vitripennis]